MLDIGAGSGLLSLVAARAGADAVVACEANPALAATARDIVAANGAADRVTVLDARSTDLDADAIGGPADMVVAEVFSDNLLSEGALATFEHAATTLARPGARFVPRAAEVRIAPATMVVDAAPLADVEGFDLTAFARHLSHDRAVRVDSTRLSLGGAATTLLRFDMAAARQPRGGAAAARLVAGEDGANGVARWIALDLGEGERYENAPGTGRPSHWAAIFTPFGRTLARGRR